MRRAIIAIAATAALIGIGQAQTPEANVAGDFVTVQPTDILSYNLIGLNVTNNQNETVGEIKDLVLSNNTLAGYIMSVGGFLGMGEHYVAVSPSAVKIDYQEDHKKWVATMNATKDQLKAAPQFKYEGRWKL